MSVVFDRDRGARLDRFVAVLAAEPFAWGVNDCSMMVARWTEAVTGERLRLPVYHSRAEADDLRARHDGLEEIFCAHAARLRLYETRAPKLGDIGLVPTLHHGAVGILWSHGGHAIWLTEAGVKFFTPGRVLRSWAMPDEWEPEA